MDVLKDVVIIVGGIYLAGDANQYERFNEYANQLKQCKAKVLSTWHHDAKLVELLEIQKQLCESPLEAMTKIMSGNVPSRLGQGGNLAELSSLVQKCQRELEAADVVIADLNGGSVEAGYALAKGKKLITMGACQSPLNFLQESGQTRADDWTGVLSTLVTWSRRNILKAGRRSLCTGV